MHIMNSVLYKQCIFFTTAKLKWKAFFLYVPIITMIKG